MNNEINLKGRRFCPLDGTELIGLQKPQKHKGCKDISNELVAERIFSHFKK